MNINPDCPIKEEEERHDFFPRFSKEAPKARERSRTPMSLPHIRGVIRSPSQDRKRAATTDPVKSVDRRVLDKSLRGKTKSVAPVQPEVPVVVNTIADLERELCRHKARPFHAELQLKSVCFNPPAYSYMTDDIWNQMLVDHLPWVYPDILTKYNKFTPACWDDITVKSVGYIPKNSVVGLILGAKYCKKQLDECMAQSFVDGRKPYIIECTNSYINGSMAWIRYIKNVPVQSMSVQFDNPAYLDDEKKKKVEEEERKKLEGDEDANDDDEVTDDVAVDKPEEIREFLKLNYNYVDSDYEVLDIEVTVDGAVEKPEEISNFIEDNYNDISSDDEVQDSEVTADSEVEEPEEISDLLERNDIGDENEVQDNEVAVDGAVEEPKEISKFVKHNYSYLGLMSLLEAKCEWCSNVRAELMSRNGVEYPAIVTSRDVPVGYPLFLYADERYVDRKPGCEGDERCCIYQQYKNCPPKCPGTCDSPY